MRVSLSGIGKAVVLVLAMGLGACAFTPHEVELAPHAAVASSEVGKGTKVLFRFVDERDDTTVGHRAPGSNGAKISADQLPLVVEKSLRDGLRQKQFEFADSETSADALVTYRLRSFKFDIERGFFTGGRNAAAALAVDARGRDQSYTNVYRYNSEERIMFVPGGDEINGQMNEALNQILSKALSDAALDKALAVH